jgi:hypothetical protein
MKEVIRNGGHPLDTCEGLSWSCRAACLIPEGGSINQPSANEILILRKVAKTTPIARHARGNSPRRH